jgi:hypothetical protein
MDLSDISAGARRRAEQALAQAWIAPGPVTQADTVRIVLEAITADHPALGAATVALQRWSDAGERPRFVIQAEDVGYSDIARVVIDAVENHAAEQAESARADVCDAPDPEFEIGDVVEWYHGSNLLIGQIVSHSPAGGMDAYYRIDRGEGTYSYVRKGAVRSAARPVAPWIPQHGDPVAWDHDGGTRYGTIAGRCDNSAVYWPVAVEDSHHEVHVHRNELRPAPPRAPWIPKIRNEVEWDHEGEKRYGVVTAYNSPEWVEVEDLKTHNLLDANVADLRPVDLRPVTSKTPWVPKIGDAVMWYEGSRTRHGIVGVPPCDPALAPSITVYPWVETDDGGGLYIGSELLRPDTREFTKDPLADGLYDEVCLALVAVRAQCLLLAEREGRSIRRTDVVGLEAHARSCNSALRALARFAGRPVTCQAPDCKRVVEPKDNTCDIHRGAVQ